MFFCCLVIGEKYEAYYIKTVQAILDGTWTPDSYYGTMADGNKELRGGDNLRLILQYGQKSDCAVFQRAADYVAGVVGKTHPGFLPEGTGTCERVLGYSLSRKHPQGVEVCCQARPNLQ